ncbi:MAG: type II toxin-antitoxin system RelE/ParE family toxin [Neisseriaceae bacterium]|nr:type II toxin-antitoxin system RelE/ParE family toxin [Neisseriaceae bacterium]
MRYTVEKTDEFNAWFSTLKDKQAQRSISVRAVRAEQGNFGNYRPLRCGVSEMKIDIGKGYRVYYTIRRQKVIFLLCGGDKSTQDEDIKRAIKIAEQIK